MKSITNIVLISIITMALSGCFWDKKVIKPVIAVQHKTICIDPPKSTHVFMRDVDPTAVKDDLGVYWVGITPKHYENLSQNIDDMFGAIVEKSSIINYYKKCVSDSNKKKENTNDIDR